jgi:hypothetical protein
MNQEHEHLRLLAIFHWVVAGIAALVALLPLIHLAIGIAMISGAFPDPKGQASIRLVGWLFVAFASVWIACGLAFAVCLALAGRCLSQRRRYTYCLVMAGIACAFMPFGTVLGVFTIMLLTRESVRALFAASSPKAALD